MISLTGEGLEYRIARKCGGEFNLADLVIGNGATKLIFCHNVIRPLPIASKLLIFQQQCSVTQLPLCNRLANVMLCMVRTGVVCDARFQ